MACEAPCFDCPYLRDSEKLKISDDDIFDLMFEHHTEDGARGGYDPYICEEQGDICFGQIQMIANGLKTGLDEFSEIGEVAYSLSPNTKDYFHGPWEYMAYHAE